MSRWSDFATFVAKLRISERNAKQKPEFLGFHSRTIVSVFAQQFILHSFASRPVVLNEPPSRLLTPLHVNPPSTWVLPAALPEAEVNPLVLSQ